MPKNVKDFHVDEFGDLEKNENIHANFENSGRDAGLLTGIITQLARPDMTEEGRNIMGN